MQELYKALWYEEYDGMLEHIRKYCIYEEEQENWSCFYAEAESSYEEWEPLINNLDEKYEFITAQEIMERVEEITGGETVVEVSASSETEEALMAYGKVLGDILQRGIE